MKNQPDSQNSWSIRSYTSKDKDGVFALRNAVYGKAFKEKEWNWKFINKSAGRTSRIFVAESNGLIVGLRPIICSPIKTMQQYRDSGLDVDMMVHPGFRNLGIFTRLVRESINTVQIEGVNIILSFPNENSYPGLMRNKSVKWRHVSTVPLLAMPLNFNVLSRSFIRISFLQKPGAIAGKILYSLVWGIRSKKQFHGNNLSIKRVTSFDERFDILWQAGSDQFNFAIKRDSSYLKWRYIEKPDTDYVIFTVEKNNELAGYIILKQSKELFGLELGLIVDILTLQDDQVIDALLSKAIDYFKEQKVKVIGCIMLPHTAYHKALKKHGFISIPKGFSPKQFYFMVHTNPNVISDKNACNADNWFITFGDIDIV